MLLGAHGPLAAAPLQYGTYLPPRKAVFLPQSLMCVGGKTIQIKLGAVYIQSWFRYKLTTRHIAWHARPKSRLWHLLRSFPLEES